MINNSVVLNATNLYSSIQSRPKIDTSAETIQSANQFQDNLKVAFNKFSKMSPQEILSHIKTSQISGSTSSSGLSGINIGQPSFKGEESIATGAVNSLKQSLELQERTARKSLVNEASLVEVLATSTEAANNMEALVAVRDKFIKAYESLINMTI